MKRRVKRVFDDSALLLKVFKGEPSNDNCGWCLHGNFEALSDEELKILGGIVIRELAWRVGPTEAQKTVCRSSERIDYAKD